MKNTILLVLLSIATVSFTNAQDRPVAAVKNQKSVSESEMKSYVMVFLKAGPNRDQPKEKAENIQKLHLDYLQSLNEEGVLLMAGPIMEEKELKGILILNLQDINKAKTIVEEDPAVAAGRLIAEYHVWYTKSGEIILP